MREIRYIQAINEALREEMRRDPRVFVLGEDVRQGAFGQTAGQVQVPVTFRFLTGAPCHNAPQHSDQPYPMFMNNPGLKIVAPSNPYDMKGLLKQAIRDSEPVLVLESINL